MEIIAHNPSEGVYPASADYVHAMEVRGHERLLLVAGAMGRGGGGGLTGSRRALAAP